MSQTALATSAVENSATVVAAPPVSGAMLLSQVGSMLALVLLLIVVIAWAVRKFGLMPHHAHNRLLKTVSQCQVGQRERVVIVEVEETWLVLGVTPQNITLLLTLPAKATEPVDEADKVKDFRHIIAKALKRSDKSAS